MFVSRPRVARPIAVELDAVAVGVPEIECLTHSVVRGAFESDSGIDQAVERSPKGSPRGIKEGDVVQPCRIT